MSESPNSPKPDPPPQSPKSGGGGASGTHLENVSPTETVHHESRSKKRRQAGGRMGELNLTAMLDICFLLLIFFVLTASFVMDEGILPADLPVGESDAADEAPPLQPIQITLRSLGGGEVAIDLVGQASPPANFQELYERLAQLQASDDRPDGLYTADDPVIIRAESAVRWSELVGAFNASVRAQYTNVNFAQPRD